MEAAVRILLVEDEKKVAKALQEGLEHEGYSIRVAHTGKDGFYLISSEPFDLIILDVMLPGRSGLEILSTARANGLRTPVLILTARDAVEDRVVGLDSGADDYLVKPFAFPELQARLGVLLRRGTNEPVTKLRSGGLEMDLAGRTAIRDGQTLDLTAREFELLEYLIRNRGRVVTREMLARDVLKESARPRRWTASLTCTWYDCGGKSTTHFRRNLSTPFVAWDL